MDMGFNFRFRAVPADYTKFLQERKLRFRLREVNIIATELHCIIAAESTYLNLACRRGLEYLVGQDSTAIGANFHAATTIIHSRPRDRTRIRPADGKPDHERRVA